MGHWRERPGFVARLRFCSKGPSRDPAGRVEAGGMNRKLDVGGTLSQAFSTYGAQAGVLG